MGLHFKLFINKIKRLTNTIFSLDHIKKINVPKSRNVKYFLWSQSKRIEFNCIRNKDKPCIRMHWYTFVNCLLHNSIFEKITFPMVLLSSQKMLTGERDWTAGGKWWPLYMRHWTTTTLFMVKFTQSYNNEIFIDG